MLKAFPDAPVYTSVYDPAGTFPEFAGADVRASRLNAIVGFRHDPRRAFPLLARTFSNMRVDADVTVCSSSGWAHGCAATGYKVVYCYNPARWLYQSATTTWVKTQRSRPASLLRASDRGSCAGTSRPRPRLTSI